MKKVKLNLGCGSDVRLGYINVDVRPGDHIMQANAFEITQDNQTVEVEEILALNLIQYAGLGQLGDILKNWTDILLPEGTITIQAPDYELVMNHVVTGRLNIHQANELLFGADCGYRGCYNLGTIALTLEDLQMEILEKTYVGYEMFIRARKKAVASIGTPS